MLNDIVIYHRKQAGLSRHALADLAGVSPTVIYHLEKGKQTLQWNIVTAILKALNISIRFVSPIMEDYEKSQSLYT